MAAVTFDHRSTQERTRLAEATGDVDDLIVHVRSHAGELGVDADRLALWVCSMGSPVALPAALIGRPAFLRCLVSYYAIMDLAPLRPETSGE